MGNQITIIINVYNEEKNIEECIESARILAGDIIVIDTHSSDDTAKIAKELGVQVVPFPYSRYVEPSRVFSVQKASGPWVFLLDADERMTLELAQEIQRQISTSTHSYFKVRRKNIFSGKWLRHGGWWPDYVVKLIDKKRLIDWPTRIHSSPLIDGTYGLLNNPLSHFFHPSLENMVTKTGIFEDIESELLYKAGKPVSTFTFFRKFFGELNRRLILKGGFMDGTYGVIESLYQAYSKTITYLMLYEKYHHKKSSAI